MSTSPIGPAAARRHTLVVGQAGGPTPVINSSLAGVIRAAQAAGFRRILGLRYGVRGLLAGDYHDLSALTPADLAALRATPSSALGACRLKLDAAQVAAGFAALQALDAGAFIYIGGNDSADTAHRLAAAAAAAGDPLRVLAVPKTMDNDLPATDHCPGYGSVARYVATATLETTLDTRAMPETYPVKILEVAGRYAGWIAAAAALARTVDPTTPHLIYVPERPFILDSFLADVRAVLAREGHCIIVISENLNGPDGQRLETGPARFVDPFGHAYYPGPADMLCQELLQRGIRARFDKPGTLQRMAGALISPVDQDEAERCGAAAVQAASAGATDQMVALRRVAGPIYHCDTSLVPLSAIANTERLLPDAFLAAAGNDITAAFVDYALPLIGGPLPAYFQWAPGSGVPTPDPRPLTPIR
ncbi:MAG TPA: diphosphate--fructose-6-phosphate 1-phosphotransferase [Chloroflexia bacterium]|nr:diphosphate--fructose-6-phosphate 1-phosphotransferase [Chloroflexia bacterium]